MWHLTGYPAALLVGLCVFLYPGLSAAGTKLAPNLSQARAHHTATLLANGKVLVAGGHTTNGASLSSAEIYDPLTNTWTSAGTFTTARYNHTATLLPNGKVLVMGGQIGLPGHNTNDSLPSAELYDPSTNTWTHKFGLTEGRYSHTATLMSSGSVLIAGGINSQSGFVTVALYSTELYEPATDTSINVGRLTDARGSHTATLIAGGRVLVAGGNNGPDRFVDGGAPGIKSSAELFDTATYTWTSVGALATGRMNHTASLLATGKVLVAGGNVDVTVLASAELFDPSTNTWTNAGSLLTGRTFHTETTLPNGKVIVATGLESNLACAAALSVEMYDPETNIWSSTFPLATTRQFQTATQLADGKVLMVGGWNCSGTVVASTELYDPDRPRSKPTLTHVITTLLLD